MSSVISTASYWKHLRGSVQEIMGDDLSSNEAQYKKFCKVIKATKAFHDFPEYALDALLQERGEGTPIQVGRLLEGQNTRVIMRTFAAQVVVDSEARDDEENDKVLDLSRRLKRAAAKTKDIDAAQFLNRFNNVQYVFADGKPLASATHARPDGGTFSNTLAVAAAPSVAAIQTIRSNLMKLEGYDGTREGYMIKKIICPVDQINAWEIVLGSSQVPGSNNNDINVVKPLGIELVPVLHWTGTTTSWGVITDAEGGMTYAERQKDTYRDWVDENTDTFHFSVKYRSGRTNTNNRAHYWSEI